MINSSLEIEKIEDCDGRYSLFSSFNSTRFHAIRLSKYNCSVRVEDEYHTEHGQAALRRDFNFDSPVTQ